MIQSNLIILSIYILLCYRKFNFGDAFPFFDNTFSFFGNKLD